MHKKTRIVAVVALFLACTTCHPLEAPSEDAVVSANGQSGSSASEPRGRFLSAAHGAHDAPGVRSSSAVASATRGQSLGTDLLLAAPETFIDSGPSHYTNSTTAVFAFSTDTGTEFAYDIDGGGWSGWSSATSVDISPQTEGAHTFSVKARGGAKEDPSPARYTWVVIESPSAVDMSAADPPSYWAYGESRFDFAGFAVAIGDVDGDSYDDMLIGAPSAEGSGGTLSVAGRVYLAHGGASFSGGLDLTGGASSTFFGSAQGDQLGTALATGDVNGDGCADMIMASPSSSALWVNGGAVTVVFGRGSGCAVTTALPASWDLSAPPQAEYVVIYGANPNDAAGLSVAVGNVNGDAYDDIVIDAGAASPFGRTKAGKVYVVFGRAHNDWANLADAGDSTPGGFPAHLELGILSRTYHVLGADGSETGINGGDQLRIVGCSDLTGDGSDELVMIATEADGPSNARPDAGEVYVILGGAALSADTVVDLQSGADMVVYGSASAPLSSAGVGGNFNGDLSGTSSPLNDLVLGSTGASTGAGQAYVVYGAEALPAAVDLSASGWSARITGEAGEALGVTALIADTNGDTTGDLVLSAWTANYQGKVVVLPGGGFAAGDLDITLGGFSPSNTFLGRAAGDMFGFSLAAGDLNGDSSDDLLVGAVFTSGDAAIPAGRARDYCGESYVFQGSEPPAGPPEGPPEGFVRVEPGTFTMGSPTSEEGRSSNEVQHEVTLTGAYYIQEIELTQSQFNTLMGWNPSSFSGCDACPVETLTWFETVAYTNELSINEGLTPCYVLSDVQCEDSSTQGSDYMACMSSGRGGVFWATVALNGVTSVYDCEGYRLPTEAEWEYAARAGTTSATYQGELVASTFDCGLSQPALNSIAWYCYNDSGATEVGAQLQANAWGIYDMLGNVLEWCWDWEDNYGTGAVTDPEGPGTGTERIVRGGAFPLWPFMARAAYRDLSVPSNEDYMRGARIVRSAF